MSKIRVTNPYVEKEYEVVEGFGDIEYNLHNITQGLKDFLVLQRRPKMTEEELSKVMTDLYHDICDNSGESFVRIDGYEYYTDMGYAIEGIEFFMFLLKKRLEKMKEES